MDLAKQRRARIRRQKLFKVVRFLAVLVSAAALTSFITYKAIAKNPELISPLPDGEDCIQLNIEVNPSIEKNQNENRKPTNTDSQESGSSSDIRESDNEFVTASYYTTEYCERFNPSCLTASGEVFNDYDFTAACHSRFKLGTKILLTSDQGSVTIKCNDRGSFSEKYGRTFDLTKAAFSKLSPLSKGIVKVAYKVVN